MHKIAKEITVPFQTSLPDVMLAAYNDTEPGFLRLKVTKATIACEYYTIDFQDNPQGVRDSFTVPLTDQPSPTASRDTTPKQRHRHHLSQTDLAESTTEEFRRWNIRLFLPTSRYWIALRSPKLIEWSESVICQSGTDAVCRIGRESDRCQLQKSVLIFPRHS
jgi:hypothetical protein